ncbi:MAG TPA: hypothetical protein VIV82_01900, partial [Verrucomicrobiae bacterium]
EAQSWTAAKVNRKAEANKVHADLVSLSSSIAPRHPAFLHRRLKSAPAAAGKIPRNTRNTQKLELRNE